MNILHVTSDWKWTGPAEPMLVQIEALAARGHSVALACPDAPGDDSDGVARHARARGIEVALALDVGRGIRPLRDRRDAARLRGSVEELRADVVHVWHSRAHGLALRAMRERRKRGSSVLVRSRTLTSVPRAPWERWLFGRGADAVACASEGLAAAVRRQRPRGATACVPGAIDLERFARGAEERVLLRAAGREALGLPDEMPVIGVVARVQAKRRFDLLLEAFAQVAREVPALRLVIIGRGTKLAEVARDPARSLGIADRVLFTGYRNHDYVALLHALDSLCYLVPGSDASCRALLEAAACGVPCLASRRAPLPELVVDGETGAVVDEDAAEIASVWRRWLAAPQSLRSLGQNARQRALSSFGPEHAAEALERLYAEALGVGPVGID